MSGDKKVIVPTKAAPGKANGRPDSPLDYLSQGWFPINGMLLQEIKKKLSAGNFNDNRRALIEELKKDYGLLGYCFKSLKGSEASKENPMKILESVSIDELKAILTVSEGDISSHSFNDIIKPQAHRLKQSALSSTTAEALAEKTGVDPTMAFACAVVRQTGLNLIAWNYPRIYAKALTLVGDGKDDLESVLFKNLGFSARQAGVSLSLPELSPNMKVALGLEPVSDPQSEGAKIAQFCELSETFALINDPEYFPAATRQHATVLKKLNHYLGPKALVLIREKMEGAAKNYGALPHRIVEQDLSMERNLEVAHKKFAEHLYSENAAANKIAPEIQNTLKKVYSFMRPQQVSPEALQILITECIPYAGFSKGCVYLLEPTTHTLIPKLRIGGRNLEEYKPLSGSAVVRSDNPILEALQSSVPVKRDGAVLFGERVSLVTGIIGNGDKTGVLYLEMDHDLSKEGGFEPVLRFKAIRHCLNQCLNLKDTPN